MDKLLTNSSLSLNELVIKHLLNIKTFTILSTFILALAVCLTSCKKPNAAEVRTEDGINLISGLSSPITIGESWVIGYLSDYVEDINEINSISTPKHFELAYQQGSNEFKVRKISNGPAVSFMTLSAENIQATIPLYNSSKKSVSYRFDPKGKQYKTVQLVGDINAWNPVNTNLKQDDNGAWSTTLNLIPARYGYQVVLDGVWHLDTNNPSTMDNGQGGSNSVLTVEASDQAMKPVLRTIPAADGSVVVQAGPKDQVLCLWENTPLVASGNDQTFTFAIPETAKNIKRSHVRLYSYNDQYGRGPDLLIPLEHGRILTNSALLDRMDKHGLIMYFLMVDRFNNGNVSNDRKTDDQSILPQANNLGGDIAGVIQKLNANYFSDLGMNTIWLSPIPKNPDGAFGLWNKGGVKSQFSAYHGYWPTSFTKIDNRFGTSDELHQLVEACHKNGNNIVLDFVANHVHELHPVYLAHKDENWFTNLHLPDGSLNTERWDEHRLTTWFDVFLPTLNLEKQAVAEMLSDSMIYWLKEYQIDGFRHDATKHIPLNFWRTLTEKVKVVAAEEHRSVYQVGETYGTPELISSYISTGMLDGQFDFNVFDAALASVCREDVGFEKLAERIEQSLVYYGSNHLMGNMSGNQDKPRLMSMATGEVRFDEDSKLAGWTRSINDQTKEGFQRVGMMHAINLFIPGVPCLYYGDEIGMPGGNDPDNRRMMKFEDLSQDELALRSTVSQLAHIRREQMPLLYGDFKFHEAKGNRLLASRTYFNETIFLAINRGVKNEQFSLPKQYKIDEKLAGNGSFTQYQLNISPGSFALYKFTNS